MDNQLEQTIHNKTNIWSLLLLVVAISLLVVACGGGTISPSDVPSLPTNTSNNNSAAPNETPSNLVGKKNEGGITYTAGVNLLDPAEDIDTDGNGVPDRVDAHIDALYPGKDASSIAKATAMRSDTKEYIAVLSLTHSQLPKNKAEAAKIIYSDEAFSNYCKFDKAFSITEFEQASREMSLLNLDSALKVQRYKEIEKLAGYQSLSRDCK